MPLQGQALEALPWEASQARVGPTLLAANTRVQGQLRATRTTHRVATWPEQGRFGLGLEADPATGTLTLLAGEHLELNGKVWSWEQQAVPLPAPIESQVYFLCADLQGALSWRIRVPAATLTVLGYVLLEDLSGTVTSLRAIRTQTWCEHTEGGRLVKAYEGLHDWKAREEFYRYDEAGRIREIVAVEAERTYTSQYAFDAEGRLIQVQRSITQTEPFLLDGLYRLNGALFWRGTV